MGDKKATVPEKPWTAAMLRKLPREQRDAILEAAAAAAEPRYRLDRALTDFEAFCPGGLHGESAAAPEG
jgi:hypothetical protein